MSELFLNLENKKILITGHVNPDGDGVIDGEDAFPLDPNEYLDTDGDGIGNNACT